MLIVSLDCPFLITPSVFSSVYLLSTDQIMLVVLTSWKNMISSPKYKCIHQDLFIVEDND